VAPPSLIDVPELGQWTSQWDGLVDASPLPSPFLRSWWLTGTSGRGRHFVLVVDDGQLLGGLALEQRHRMSSIQVMGDSALCSDHIDLLAASGHEAAVSRLIGDWLGRPGDRLLDLRGVRDGSMLAEVLPGRVRREPMAAAPYALLPDSAEAFRATLTSRFRRKIRNTTNRLEGEGVSHRVLRGPAVRSGLDTLRELHRSQWQGRSEFLSSFDCFVAGCTGGIEVDEVVVHQLVTGDLVVATAFAFEVAGRASMYQSARLTDPRWKDVGVTLFASIVDDACARGLTEVDFLRGEEEWKGRFTTQRREMFRLVAGKGVMGGLGRTGTAATFYASQTAVRGVRYGRSVAARWNAKSRGRSSTGGQAPSGTSEAADDDS
jgi:CelD/BcsL family acetyltransferase involved in cellulose biosynthesis